MTDPEKYIEEDKISLRELIERIRSWYQYCLSNFKYILIAAIIGGILGYAYTFKRPTYFAETTFALEESSGMGLSQIAGLASVAGINMGQLGGGENGIFEGENIIQLYTSQRMIEQSLLTDVETEGQKEKLIYRYAKERKLDKKWQNKSYLKNLSFNIPREDFTQQHDSILFKVTEHIKKKILVVDKPTRRLNLISVKVSFKDPEFARHFNKTLVKNVNEFYYETKTKKTLEAVTTLQKQADSLKYIVDQNISEMFLAMDAIPNPNVLNRSSRTPVQQKQIDMQSTFAAYAEMLKSLELARLNHLTKTPLLQIVDTPTNYLDNDRWKWYKGIIIGMFLGGIFSVIFFTGRLIIYSALAVKDKLRH
jgi:hypothetical protein